MFSYRAQPANSQRETRQRPQQAAPAPLEWATAYGPGADIKLPSAMLHPSIDLGRDFDDPTSATSDFVKRLYRLLEDRTFDNIIGWGVDGDTFVVKDMNEFTRHVMPKMFKHSNFASFVRQLNKYDFHKVKSTNPDDAKYGEQSWTFKHPYFQSKNLDGLENVKRKVPPKKSTPSTAAPKRGTSTTPPTVDEALADRVDNLTQSTEDLRAVVARLDENYQTVLRELVSVQRTVAQQESIMQQLVQQLIGQQGPPEFKPLSLDNSYSNVGPDQSPLSMPTPSASSADNSPFNMDLGMSQADATMFSPMPTSTAPAQEVRPYQAKWSVPPRILVVDDDAVSRTVSSRFLQHNGCSFDVAADGLAAVDKCQLAKYDLVLMDISMPKLDGLSATSIIRQFDVLTPIISMTGNSTPDDVVNYFSHGMNDVLSKPFTMDNMVTLLEKHLMHLKATWGITDSSSGSGQQQQQYLAMAPQQMMGSLVAKRPREDDEDDREGKRSRFELVE
ncbi:hypothetical protein EXIGLDRAFT_844053 [Exidia glandulosa HHB12029]|uniref:Transcription factor n=1 Tax=Exidia glandulosa HHB12029 TaxID=1314781 RepID=A0A165C9W2_EXIGL|nr:hypothetical protein EXIGLDRAFT_844053 [Exidia glandulosa HHB12029]